MVITGAKSEEDCRDAARLYARKIKKCGYDKLKLSQFKVVNIVAKSSVNFKVSLEPLYERMLKLGQNCTYNPQTFPGLIYKWPEREAGD